MKKALVTGAAGFIGSHVVGALLEENIEVRALIRPGEDTRNLNGLDIEKMEGDILDIDAVRKALKGIDTLFHLAAVYSIWMKDWGRIYEVNLQGSRNVLWSALKAGINRVVYTSSIAAIGIKPGMEASTEETVFNQYTLGNHYVLTKYLSQQEALGFAGNGLDLVVVNPCFPFGTNDIVPTPTGQMIVDILSGLNRSSLNGGINIVDVRDVARGHILAAKKGRKGELYILGNKNVTMDEMMSLVRNVSGIKRVLLPKAPRAVLKAFTAGLTWWSDHISHKPPMSTPAEVEYVSQYLFFDNTKARDELGLVCTPIEESLRNSIDWFIEEGYVTV
jgi:dihydroflavonol-4-reductase